MPDTCDALHAEALEGLVGSKVLKLKLYGVVMALITTPEDVESLGFKPSKRWFGSGELNMYSLLVLLDTGSPFVITGGAESKPVYFVTSTHSIN